MNLLDPTGPPPTDPAGTASTTEITHTIHHRLPTATWADLMVLVWRRPGAAAQIIRDLTTARTRLQAEVDQLRTDLLMERARLRRTA